jgi:hypothetical protein
MDLVWFVADVWFQPALVAVLAANWLSISTATSEIPPTPNTHPRYGMLTCLEPMCESF